MFSWLCGLRFFLCTRFYLRYATSFDQISNPDPPVRIQDSRQPFFLVLSIFSTTGRSKNTCDLSKDANRVDRLDVSDDIAVNMLILQQKGSEVRLATLHHLLDGSDDVRIANDNGFVESREKRATCDGEGQDLRVDFGYGLFCY